MAEETLRTLERALEVLKTFGRATSEFTAGQVAERLALPRSVVTRILATLEHADFVERSADNPRLFRIGLAACEVGAAYVAGNPLLRAAAEALDVLAARTGLTAYLGTLRGAEVVILAHREGHAPIRFIWQAGDRLPVATTALGKALLMHMTPAQVDAILGREPLAGLTDRSLRTRADLDAQLTHYAGRGWITAKDESYPGISAVGAAVLAPDGAPLAGISLSLLTSSAGAREIALIGASVRDAAQAISRRVAPAITYSRASFASRDGAPCHDQFLDR